MHLKFDFTAPVSRTFGTAFAPIGLFAGGYTGNLLDFVNPAGLYSDAGTTLAGIGAQVHSIREQVGGGLISQTTSSFRGVREATGVKLDGFDDYYRLSWSAASEAGAFSVFTVVDLPASLSANGMIFGSTRSGSSRFAVYVQSGNGFLYFAYADTQLAITSGVLGTRLRIAITRDGPAGTGTVRLYINNALSATIPPTTLSSLPVGIGARGDGLEDRIAIRARGWMHINRLLTDDERAKLAKYWS